MKQFVTISLLCATALTLAAAPLKAPAHQKVARKAAKSLAVNKITPQRAAADGDLEAHQWTSIGTGRYTDDIMTAIFYVDNPTYDVEVQQAADLTTLYRIVNPMQHHPDLQAMIEAEGVFPTDKDYYIYFDVSDPEFVRIPLAPLGYSDEDGDASFCSISGEYEMLHYSLSEAQSYAGKFDGTTISFEISGATRIVQNGHNYLANENSALRLVLPGGTDYSVTFDNQDGFCPGDDGCYHIGINTGATVPTVRYGFFPDLADSHVMELINVGSECNPGDVVSVDLSSFPERRAYFMAITLDESGSYKDGLYTVLYNPADNSPKWTFYSKADFTDGFLSPYLGTEATTREVDVQQYTDLPGYFRVVNPYAGLNETDMQAYDHNHGHYIYLDASNPMNVVLQESPLGVYGEEYGDILIGSDYWNMVEMFGQEEVDSYGISSGGLLTDGIITFDANAGVCLYPTLYGEWFTTNVKEDGSAGDFRLIFKSTPVGIESIEADGEAEYYDLRGIRVTSPQNGIYIERHAGKVRKISHKS